MELSLYQIQLILNLVGKNAEMLLMDGILSDEQKGLVWKIYESQTYSLNGETVGCESPPLTVLPNEG